MEDKVENADMVTDRINRGKGIEDEDGDGEGEGEGGM